MGLPLAAPAAAVAAGVLAARFADFSFLECALAAAAMAVLAAVGLRAPSRRAGSAACLIGFAFSGAALASTSEPTQPDRVDRVIAESGADLEIPVRFRGSVSELPRAFADYDRFNLEVEAVFDGRPASGGVRVHRSRAIGAAPLELDVGERVEFLGRARRIHNFENPGGFDRAGYLGDQGIVLNANVRFGAPLLRLERRAVGPAAAARVRKFLSHRLDALLRRAGRSEAAAGAVLRAMLLGDRERLDDATKSLFQRSGAYHALVVSGLHVGVLAGAALAALRLARTPPAVAAGFTAALCGGYALILGAALPVSRAAWMIAAFLAASTLYRRRRPLNTLAAVALGFLAYSPERLFDAGFQLSFGAVAAIVGIGIPLVELGIEPRRRALLDLDNADRDLHASVDVAERRVALRQWLDPLARLAPLPRSAAMTLFTSTGRLLCWAAALTTVSLVLFVVLAAPMAHHFQRLAAGGPLVNLIVIPATGLVVPLGFTALALDWAAPIEAAAAVVDAMSWVAAAGADPVLDWRVPRPPWALSAAALGAAAAWIWSWRAGRLRAPATVAALAVFGLVAAHPFPPKVERGSFELTAIDVGQSEALHLALPNGESILVDAGGLPSYGSERVGFDVGESVVSPYLWSRSIRRLRAIAITHPDWDHIDGVYALLRNFRVEELWLGGDLFEEEYCDLFDAAWAAGTRIVRTRAGEIRRVGGVRFQTLGPTLSEVRRANDGSLVLLASFGETDFLLTGDIEQAAEAALLRELRPSLGGVLKVGHHGSRTSTSSALLDRFRPAVAVISAGPNNVFGHPHEEVLRRLSRRNIRAYATARDGMVTIRSDGRRLTAAVSRRSNPTRRDWGTATRPADSPPGSPGSVD